MTTSTASEVPFSVERGVSTRAICTSRSNDSRPRPTVKTGMDRALSAAIDSSSASSEVSAPSVTSTSPASGRPASSSRARSRAGASREEVPAYLRSATPFSRSAVVEKRKWRRTKRSDSALCSAPSSASSFWTKSVRGRPSRSVIVMLRESSTMTPRKFCCGTAARRTSVGRNRQRMSTPSVARRSRTSTRRSRTGPSFVMPR